MDGAQGLGCMGSGAAVGSDDVIAAHAPHAGQLLMLLTCEAAQSHTAKASKAPISRNGPENRGIH